MKLRVALRTKPSKSGGHCLPTCLKILDFPAVEAQIPKIVSKDTKEESQLLKLLSTLQSRPIPRMVTLESDKGESQNPIAVDAFFEPSSTLRPEVDQKEVFTAVSDVIVATVFHGRSGCVIASGPPGASCCSCNCVI